MTIMNIQGGDSGAGVCVCVCVCGVCVNAHRCVYFVSRFPEACVNDSIGS